MVDLRSTSIPSERGMSDTFDVTRGDTPRDSLGGGLTWDSLSDDLHPPPPKHPPSVVLEVWWARTAWPGSHGDGIERDA